MPPVGLSFPKDRSGWSPDPVVIAEEIDIAETRLRRMQVPLNQARYVIAEDVQSHFTEQSDYFGQPWQQWSDSYEQRQENLGDILERTYALEYAASNPENYVVISHSVSAGAYGGGEVALVGSNLPDYWIWHEQGSPNRYSPRSGPNPLPARPFAGLSTDAEQAIYNIFDAFVDGALIGTLAGSGQPRGRRGRFGSKFL